MGNYNGKTVAYVSASASVGQTADLVVLTGAGFSVKVTNISGTAPLFWTVSHPGGTCPIPSTTPANNSSVLVTPAVANSTTSVRHNGQFGSIVQVTSTGTPSYLVEVQGNHSTS